MILLPLSFILSIARPADGLLGGIAVFNQTTFIVSAV
jgi:hypothetical protein